MRSTRPKKKRYLKINEAILTGPINRLNDAYFKFMLASPERKHITAEFLNAALNHYKPGNEKPVKVEDVEFLDRETIPEAVKAKGARFDVLARSADGRRFHIEVQNAREKFFMKRSFYYAAWDYLSQIRKGANYDELEPVVFIGIMNFRLFGSFERPQDWYTLHRFLNVKTHEFTMREVELHMVELPLLRRYLNQTGRKPCDEFEEFMCCFNNIGGDELMQELAQRNSIFDEIRKFDELFRKDPIAVRDYFINERDKIDYANNLRYEREEGREEGIEEGREAMQRENIRKLRSNGFIDEQISRFLDIPVEVINKI